MPLLTVSQDSKFLQECKKRALSNMTDIVRNYSYGENADMLVLELGTPTSGDGIIIEVQNVFQLNDTMMQTFRIILEMDYIASFENDINFENNSIVFTVYFVQPKSGNKTSCYKWLPSLWSNPLLYFLLLMLWNPQRYAPVALPW